MSKKTLALLLVLAASILGCSGSPSASSGAPAVPAAQQALPVQMSGVVMTMGDTGPQTIMFQAEALSLSPDTEVLQLESLVKDKGNNAVADTLYKWKEKGWVRMGANLAYPIPVIRSKVLPDGGRRFIFFSARPISFPGAKLQGAATDYPLGAVEVVLSADGKGKGYIYGMLKLEIKNGEVDLSSYSGGQAQLISDVLMTPKK